MTFRDLRYVQTSLLRRFDLHLYELKQVFLHINVLQYSNIFAVAVRELNVSMDNKKTQISNLHLNRFSH